MSIGYLMLVSFLIVGATNASSVMRPDRAQREPKIETYGFVHHETTGITSFVIVNGVERPIRFHPDSDQIAVKALNALPWWILLPNCDGKRMFLVGQYFTTPKHTPKCDACPAVEEYREFKLINWYIITPFKIVRKDCENCAYLRKENLRTQRQLQRADFKDFDGIESVDVSRFQRKKPVLPRRRI